MFVRFKCRIIVSFFRFFSCYLFDSFFELTFNESNIKWQFLWESTTTTKYSDALCIFSHHTCTQLIRIEVIASVYTGQISNAFSMLGLFLHRMNVHACQNSLSIKLGVLTIIRINVKKLWHMQHRQSVYLKCIQ